jgi:hypothetical protein
VTAVLVCFALAIVPAMAAERGIDRQGDRGKSGLDRGGDQGDFVDTFGEESRVVRHGSRLAENGTAAKASNLLSAAAKQDGDQAIAMLNQILSMELPSTPETDRVLADANRRLAETYVGAPSKQVHLLGMALQYEADPVRRGRLETQITELGGDVFSLTFRGNDAAGTRDLGDADTCETATPAQASETMSIFPSGDANWRFFTVAGPLGEAYRIETVSDTPGTFDDDTDLSQYDSSGGTLLAFNDDSSAANAPFMSQIITSCLTPGTYYIEVGGFADISTPDNFDLEVEVIDTCVLPVVDAFENDDLRGDAADIGHPTSTPPHANGWGRAKKEIQARTIFPNGDRDHAKMKLTRNEFVRMETAGQFPTKFNGFSSSDPFDDADTVMEVRYPVEPEYGGRCNEPDIGFVNACFDEQDCIDNCGGSFPCNGAPLAGFPVCMPYYFFNSPFQGNPTDGYQNPLAVNDDKGGGSFGSRLLLCLPRTQPGSDSASVQDSWIVRVEPFSASDIFDYELLAKNEVQCPFEVEPNNDFELSTNAIELGDTVFGIFDFSEAAPFQDSDWYSFDVEGETLATLWTDGYDSYAVDTAFQLAIGPDDNGDFFLLATDDDGGAGFLSVLEVIIPPANELLGNVSADADYLLNVTSFYLNPNFPYQLNTQGSAAPAVHNETDAAGDCDTEGAANPVAIGDSLLASINPTCDFDAYKLTVTENTFVSVATDGGGDTTLSLYDCSDDSLLACDDDGGPGLLSLVEGCLPPGDYCARVRAFSGFATFDYGISFTGTAGCSPTDPPTVVGDGLYTCSSGFDTCP